jgi:hypothetical protein
MPRIFLIANNERLEEHHIKNLEASENDLFFLFNYMSKSYELCKTYKQKIAILRGIHKYHKTYDIKDDFYLGGNNVINNQNEFKKIVLIWKIFEDFVNKIKIDTDYLDIYNMLESFNIKKYPGNVPSTGFLGYLYAKKHFKEFEIILVGFNGEYLVPLNVHNFNWELEYYKKNKVKMISID